jgi:hypothetical protein
VGTNILALLGIGVVLFGVGLAIFDRRLSV